MNTDANVACHASKSTADSVDRRLEAASSRASTPLESPTIDPRNLSHRNRHRCFGGLLT